MIPTPAPTTFKQGVIDYLTQVLPPPSGAAVPLMVAGYYPTKPEQLPCVSVNQGAGSLEIQSIGQVWEGAHQRPDGEWVQTQGAYYREAVEVMLWTTNPHTRDQYAYVMRKALWRMVKHFSNVYDVQNMRISEQGDGQDLEGRAPVNTFSFVFEVSALVGITDEIPMTIAEGVEVSGNWGAEVALDA